MESIDLIEMGGKSKPVDMNENDMILKSVNKDVSQQVALSMAKHEQNSALYILLNFFEHEAEKEPPGGGTALQDGYWTVVQAMQEHDQFLEGMLLKNIDPSSRFPLLHYIIFNTSENKRQFQHHQEWTQIVRQGYGEGQTTHHGAYEEKFSFIEPSLPFLPKRPSQPNVAYIVSAFLAADNEHYLDANWTLWSGADFIVGSIPEEFRLVRLTLHKLLHTSQNHKKHKRSRPFSYVLLCELTEGLADVHRTLEFVDKIRDRQCGFTSLYKIDHFF